MQRHPEHRAILAAFGRQAPPSSGDDPVHWSARVGAQLSDAIACVLSEEVDAAQAAIFARRVESVRHLLDDLKLSHLRVALEARVVEMLHADPPRALRVRAAADFYYSQAARIHHQRRTPARSLEELVGRAMWTPVPGSDRLHHAVLKEANGPAGPLVVNLLRGTTTVRAVDLRSDPRSFVDAVVARGAVAAVSGGFFLYSEPDIVAPLHRRMPVGLLRSDGHTLSPPALRRSCLLGGDRPSIRRVGPVGWTVRCGDWSARVTACNAPGRCALYNRAHGRRAPRPGLRIAGTQALGVSDEIDLLGGVLVMDHPPQLRGAVSWDPPAELACSEAMAGGPMLVGEGPLLDLCAEDFAKSAPPVTFSQDETYDQNLLPRMAVGLDDHGRLVFAAIEGRDFARAPGFTLAMTADLMRALGCVQAMNLDGGSSKRMVVGGRLVDLSTTEVRGMSSSSGPAPTRRVVSALLLHA